jgi:uncharacterized protein YkwD
MEGNVPVPRKKLIVTSALVALAFPAASQATPKHAEARVARAHVAKGTKALLARKATRAKAPAPCPNADVVPTPANLDAVRVAIVCLHNQIRAQNRLPLLKGNTRLRRAAEGHSAEMVRSRYFDHTSPRGASMVDRILAAGYVRSDQGWLLGENLEWGTGSLSTPRGALDAWMKSPGHRANVLKRGYRHLGVGIALGTPGGDADGVTITVDFGARR